MDITIDVEDYKLNVRAAGIIIHNDKILIHNSAKKDHYALMGGRVAIGESSEDAVKREFKEETGKDVEIIGYIGTIENFFEMNSQKYYEIMFIYQVEFVNEEDKKITNTIKNKEGKDYLTYDWISINNIENEPIRPEVIKQIFKNGKFPQHLINKD